MTAFREALAKAAFIRTRPLLKRMENRLPRFYRALAAMGRALFPWEKRMWIRCERGFAAGLYLKLNPRFETQAIYGAAEPVEQVWREHLVPGSVFYDIGSHIGYFAVAAARRIGHSGKVYAFEPDPANARFITENSARNSVEVEVVEKAAWKRSGERRRFVRASPSSDPSRMGGRLATGQPGKETIGVETVALDEFVRSHRPPTFVKIDVEGAEADVLEGARELLERFRPTLVIEIHDHSLRAVVEEILEPLGYQLRPMPPEDRLWLALPNAGIR